MEKEEIYREFARLLGTSYDCVPFSGHKRTRWNNRKPGSGRYPGFGTIRIYGDTVHVALRKPCLNMVGSVAEAREAVRLAMADIS